MPPDRCRHPPCATWSRRRCQHHAHPLIPPRRAKSRLNDLGVGRYGERAGDVLLVAHNGDRDEAQDRFYFAAPYHSWHGSPSAQDSRISLIVARPEKTTPELRDLVQSHLGREPRMQDVGAVVVSLRYAEGKQ